MICFISGKTRQSLHQLYNVSQGHSQSRDVQSQLKDYLLPEVEMTPILRGGGYELEQTHSKVSLFIC